MRTMNDTYRDSAIGVTGFIAAITLDKWSSVASACAGTFTAIYMGCKLWKEIVKPWMKKKGWL